jgi:putative copper export protein
MLKYHRPTPGSRGLNLNASSTCARRRQYRALLDAKIALVGVMIALALFNRFRLAPRLAPAAAASSRC